MFSGITVNPALGVASDLLVGAGGTSILAETTELLSAEHLLLGSRPAPGNIAGGLTTIEEKSLGAARKGGTAPISDVLDYAKPPTSTGLFVIDTPGQDIEQMVAMVAAGAQIVAFTTGRGTPTGSPIAPCIKISSNSEVAHRLPELIDIDAGPILDHSAFGSFSVSDHVCHAGRGT